MPTPIPGFPHGNSLATIGGFLTPAPSGGGDTIIGQMAMDPTNYPGFTESGTDPFGQPYIRTGEDAWVWEGPAFAPPFEQNVLIEFSFRDDGGPSNPRFMAFGYNAVGFGSPPPFFVINGVGYTFALISPDGGPYELVFWDTVTESPLDPSVAWPGGVPADRRVPLNGPVLGDGRWWRVVLETLVSAGSTTTQFTLRLYDEDNVEVTLLGNTGVTLAAGVDALYGFNPNTEDMEYSGVWIANSLAAVGRPRIYIPGEAAGPVVVPPVPYAPELRRTLALVCPTPGTAAEATFTNPYVSTAKANIPVGDQAENVTIKISATCDGPLTISGVEWTGWVLNNTRRI